jgi:hypothetical protein
MLNRRNLCRLGGAFVVAAPMPALAQAPLAAPSGKVILTISGLVGTTNQPGVAAFDLQMLEALGVEAFETMTPWYATKVKFEGVAMTKILRAVSAKGQKLSVAALNDYKTEIPVEDFEKYNVILALKRDGNYMPVSDKGPLFIVYPFDAHPELKSQKFYGRSAWQVAKIAVL